jgi:hypothetical protein
MSIFPVFMRSHVAVNESPGAQPAGHEKLAVTSDILKIPAVKVLPVLVFVLLKYENVPHPIAKPSTPITKTLAKILLILFITLPFSISGFSTGLSRR